MADYTKDSYYQLSLNILKALGGDISIPFADADAIWDEIYKIYDHAGGRFDIVPLQKTIIDNGTYEYYPDNDADAFMPVSITVNVPQKYTDEQVESLTDAARQEGYDSGHTSGFADGKLVGQEEGFRDGFTEGETVGANTQKAKLAEIQITENGIYTREDGYKTVTVEIEAGISEEEVEAIRTESFNEGYTAGESDGYNDGYAEGLDDGAEDQKALLTTIKITENGVYEKEDGYKTVTVEVAGSGGGDTGKPKIYNGFKLLSTDTSLSTSQRLTTLLKEVDFTQYDWSSVYDLSEFFGGFMYNSSYNASPFYDSDFDNFREGYNGQMVSCVNMFKNPSGSSNGSLAVVPDFSMFTDRLVDMNGAFSSYALRDASNIAKWNTSNVTNMSNLFYNCSKLLSVPVFDTSSAIDMNAMFYGCSQLKTVPLLDYSNAIDISRMFYGCSRLTEIPDLDISSAQSFGGSSSSSWLYGTTNITSIGTLQCDDINNIGYMFGGSSNTKITYFGGAINLGSKPTGLTNFNSNYAFNYVPNLTYESVMNVINGLYDRAAAGYPVETLKLHTNHLAMLSDDDIAIATNKGWTLA